MDVSNDALGLILERVDSHVWLIRAAAVCKRWHRAITDTSFLRHFRSLHAPSVAGYYHNGCHRLNFLMDVRTGDTPVFIPSSPSMVDARHFSLDFLLGGAASWCITDSRDSLLVVTDGRGRAFLDHIVCEPLTRHYMRIPRPADSKDSRYCWGPYLLDGEANEVGSRIGMSNFRVLRMFGSDDVTHTTIVTAGSSWSQKNIDHIAPNLERAWALGRAAGSCNLYDEGGSMTLIDLNSSSGDFSSSVLPATENWGFRIQRYNCFVTEDCDGKPRIIVVFDNAMKVFARLDSTEWALEKEILLSEATCSLPGYQPSVLRHSHNIVTMGVGFVILSQSRNFGGPWLFSINLATMEVAPAAKNLGRRVYQCELPWPPALHACLD